VIRAPVRVPMAHPRSCRSAPTIRGSRGSRRRTRTAASCFADRPTFIRPGSPGADWSRPVRTRQRAARRLVRDSPAAPGRIGAIPSPSLPQILNRSADGLAARPAPPRSCSPTGSGSPTSALEGTGPGRRSSKATWTALGEVPSQVTTLTDEALTNHVQDHSFHPRTQHELYDRPRRLIAAIAARVEAQRAHLFVCGRECGRKLHGTTRTTRHHGHLSTIALNPVFAQVKGRILRQGSGADEGTRTPNPLFTSQTGVHPLRATLYQMGRHLRKRPRRPCQIVRRRPSRPGSAAAFPSPSLPRTRVRVPLLARGTLLHTAQKESCWTTPAPVGAWVLADSAGVEPSDG